MLLAITAMALWTWKQEQKWLFSEKVVCMYHRKWGVRLFEGGMYRIIESLRLEETSKIKSNHQPSATVPAKPCPEVQYLRVFWTTDGDFTTSLGSLFQCLTTLSVEKFFLISNLNLPWHNLRPLPLVLLYLRALKWWFVTNCLCIDLV